MNMKNFNVFFAQKCFCAFAFLIAFNSMALMLCTVKASISFDIKLDAISTIETDTNFLLCDFYF
jgi:hypothetical protein